MRSTVTRLIIPSLDRELGLMLRNLVGDLQFEILGANALVEIDRGAAPVVAFHRTLAGEECHHLMLADLQIAEVDLLHAALEQGIGLARRVQIILHFLVVDLDRDRVQGEKRSHVHRHINRDLRVGGEQQLLLEHEQILVQVDDVLLETLHFLIQGLEVGRRRPGGVRRRQRAAVPECGGGRRGAAVAGAGAGAAAATAAAGDSAPAVQAQASSIPPTTIDTTRDLKFIADLSVTRAVIRVFDRGKCARRHACSRRARSAPRPNDRPKSSSAFSAEDNRDQDPCRCRT